MKTILNQSLISIIIYIIVIALNGVLYADETRPPLSLGGNSSGDSVTTEDYGGLSLNIVKKQIFEPVQIATKEQIAKLVTNDVKKTAESLIKENNRSGGNKIIVPDDFQSIQAAINGAKPGDTVLVRPGIYFEQLNVQAGIKLVSFASGLDKQIKIKGAILKLPERAVKTIIDGSRNSPSKHGMIDFAPGCDLDTVVDGFTIQNLPAQNHHIPGHAHAVNLRGASPILMNCIIQNNGSTGIGSHVIYHDQEKEIADRDFRYANIKHKTSALIYNNIVRNNLGRGIGCNHFASPTIIGNEVMDNDDSSLGEPPGPGIGVKHGASPVIIGNIVHHNHGGGILIKYGVHQGKHHVDKRPAPALEKNLIYSNGVRRPALSCRESGTKLKPIKFTGNYIFDFGNIGIGIGYSSFGIIENNVISNGSFAGIAVRNSTAVRITGNTVADIKNSAYAFVNFSKIKEFSENRIFNINNSPFILQDSSVEGVNY